MNFTQDANSWDIRPEWMYDGEVPRAVSANLSVICTHLYHMQNPCLQYSVYQTDGLWPLMRQGASHFRVKQMVMGRAIEELPIHLFDTYAVLRGIFECNISVIGGYELN